MLADTKIEMKDKSKISNQQCIQNDRYYHSNHLLEDKLGNVMKKL